MADFNKVLEPGDYQNGRVNTVVEIPEGSINKVEWDRTRAAFVMERVEPSKYPKPTNYGFIPQTLDGDGDELDTLIVAPQPLPVGVWLEATIIGVMNFEDDGEDDHKIVVVPADDRDNKNAIKTLDDLGQAWMDKVADHFTHYKDEYKPGSTKVLGWGDIAAAKKIIAESIERYKSQ